MKLPAEFYLDDDVVRVSRDLLGKLLCTRIDGATCKVVITETEAYAGECDKASHAFGGRRTLRTEPMYGPGGHAYVYLCYGIHHLFNVVTNIAGVPHAVLVRAARPHTGLPVMLQRRRQQAAGPRLMPGPGTVSQALGITTALTRASLRGNKVWIEDAGFRPAAADIDSGPRIGVDYAAEDAARPYRFVWTQADVRP
jgi:DNA-3-methyladenine glycosylase